MSTEKTMVIRNPNNDYAMVQNYVVQLVAENKLTPHAFVLYAFYMSIGGFVEIKVGYRYIKENTGISVGNISKCNKLLEENGLIKKIDNGWKRTFNIELTPNYLIPRRTLKVVRDEICSVDENCSSGEKENHEMNTESAPCSSGEHIYRLQQNILYKENTTTAVVKNPKKTQKLDTKKQVDNKNILYNADEANLIDVFITSWKNHYQSEHYTKGDYEAVKKIKDPVDALKYVEVLWCLDEVDDWIKNGDHTFSIFVKEYNSGKVQSYYPKTAYSTKTMPA